MRLFITMMNVWIDMSHSYPIPRNCIDKMWTVKRQSLYQRVSRTMIFEMSRLTFKPLHTHNRTLQI